MVIQGSHPGDSGKSVLEYLLQDHPTIPSDLGVFLRETWRLHPKICRFISDAVYEGRLSSAPPCKERTVTVPDRAKAIMIEAGLVFVPVDHDGNAQASDEEVTAVAGLVDELLGRERQPGKVRVGFDDILFVAPNNLQVRALKEHLGDHAKVGSVDRFQGQQAPVVILSMCASDGDASPRGIEFLFNRNRLNVALSRAQSLAVVVANPALARTRCSTLEQMRLVNLFAWVVEEGR